MMLSLSEVLRTKLIPWSQQNAGERFIVARAKMRQADMPAGVQLHRHQPEPPRIVIKDRRCYNNVRNVVAEWPNAGLHELGKYALVCVLDGHVNYPLGNYRLRCGPGHFIFSPPGIPRPDGSQTYVDLQKSTSCNTIIILLHPNALECWTSHGHSQGRERSNNCLVLHDHAVSLFQTLMEEVTSGEGKELQIREKLLNLFLSVLQREMDAGRFQPIRPQHQLQQGLASVAPTDFATLLKHYIRNNLRQPLTLDRAARDMYLSPSQFTRKVRRETGQSFNRLLVHHRLEEAKSLLHNSKWTISAIAELTGFHSVSYFCTLFKERLGETPSEFRARPAEIASDTEN